MLYVSIKDKNQTYTAFQALNLQDASFDGRIAPLRIPVFSDAQLKKLRAFSFGRIVTDFINKFFGTNVKEEDIETCLRKNLLISDSLDRKTLLINLNSHAEGISYSLINDIYRLLSGNSANVPSLPKMMIQAGLLFGLYGDLFRCGIRELDVAVSSYSNWGLDFVYFARKMGLPVRMITCGCANEDAVWTLMRKGALTFYDADAGALLYAYSSAEAERYSDCCRSKVAYNLTEEQVNVLNSGVFTSVVSVDRRQDIISNIYSTYGKKLTADAAGAYGALQDYRSISGENRCTILFCGEI